MVVPVATVGGLSAMQLGNAGEVSRYPFEDDFQAVSASGDALPDWAVVDAFFCARDGVGSAAKVLLTGFHAGPGLVSAVFSSGSGDPALCSVPRSSFEPYRPFPAVDSSGVLRGSCSFGDVYAALQASGRTSFTLKFPDGVPLLGSLVAHLPAPGVTKFVDDISGSEVSGDVVMDMPDGLSAEEEGPGRVRLSASPALAELVEYPCYRRWNSEEFVNSKRPIRSINGTPVGRSGVFHIVFTTADLVSSMK